MHKEMKEHSPPPVMEPIEPVDMGIDPVTVAPVIAPAPPVPEPDAADEVGLALELPDTDAVASAAVNDRCQSRCLTVAWRKLVEAYRSIRMRHKIESSGHFAGCHKLDYCSPSLRGVED